MMADDRILQHYGLTPDQQAAILNRDPVVLVTAGAGSGKTRTLVGRYLWAVQQGIPPRRMAAITFTEKAAREMRSRVRSSIRDVLALELPEGQKKRWQEAAAQMDSARIGTIHSLCAEVLRNHPAEAGVDPEFTVLDEGLTAAIRASIVQAAVAWAAGEQAAAPLFEMLTPAKALELLDGMLSQRLDVADAAEAGAAGVRDVIGASLEMFVESAPVREAFEGFRELESGGMLLQDAGDKLALQVEGLLAAWEELVEALEAGRVIEAAAVLFQARRSLMATNIGKGAGRAKPLLKGLREAYDEQMLPWLGGGKSDDPVPDADLEERFPEDLRRLQAVFGHARGLYLDELERQRALDFDALEAGALALLQLPAIQARWQARFDLVLVDEFQDTNARQRELLEALTGAVPGAGKQGALFLVGDARQSIYRFRGADVTVFRKLEQDVYGARGSSLTLDATFRSHEHLLRTLDVLVGGPMNAGALPAGGALEGADDLYHVPYTALRSMRGPGEGKTPAVTMILSRGDSAVDARPAAASALALELLEKKEQGAIGDWEEVALLFRASTGFSHYEEALEARNIPYITVAGRGFYDRPEIRDVLNMLAALASPRDDAAMAGLLRSPAVGMSDVGLYRLRMSAPGTLYDALPGVDLQLPGDEQARQRSLSLLEAYLPLVDRERVSVLIKSLLDTLDYRPMLASSGARLWRNLDKLVEDARASGMVRVRAFLEYVRTLRDVGVREGEAPASAEGAVRLMTIHKAKGLEFPVVVLADASRRPGGRGNPFYVSPETGMVFKPDGDSQPLLYRYARWLDQRQEKAEEMRLLYVAATRAKDHLILSGFLSQSRSTWRAEGWTGLFLEQAGLDPGALAENPGRQLVDLGNGEMMEIWSAPDELPLRSLPADAEEAGGIHGVMLMDPLRMEEPDTADRDEPEPDWRATGHAYPPAAAVGSMVHAALRSWLFPGDGGLEQLLEAAAYEKRLLDPRQRTRAAAEAWKLLERFHDHPLREEIEGAEERWFEVPYTAPRPGNRGADTGRIDLLYRLEGTWYVVDYKTDELEDEAAIQAAVAAHCEQVERYRAAVRGLLRSEPVVRLCFLDAQGAVRVEEIGNGPV